MKRGSVSTSHHAEIFLQARGGAGPNCAEMRYGKLATASRSKALVTFTRLRKGKSYEYRASRFFGSGT